MMREPAGCDLADDAPMNPSASVTRTACLVGALMWNVPCCDPVLFGSSAIARWPTLAGGL